MVHRIHQRKIVGSYDSMEVMLSIATDEFPLTSRMDFSKGNRWRRSSCSVRGCFALASVVRTDTVGRIAHSWGVAATLCQSHEAKLNLYYDRKAWAACSDVCRFRSCAKSIHMILHVCYSPATSLYMFMEPQSHVAAKQKVSCIPCCRRETRSDPRPLAKLPSENKRSEVLLSNGRVKHGSHIGLVHLFGWNTNPVSVINVE